MNHIPTIAEELNRKGIDSVLWLVESVQKGAITEDQYAVGIQSIWNTVSGLAKGEFFEVISEATPEETARFEHRRVLTDGAQTYVVRWQSDADKFELVRIPGWVSKTVNHAPTKQTIDTFVGTLTKRGFWEV